MYINYLFKLVYFSFSIREFFLHHSLPNINHLAFIEVFLRKHRCDVQNMSGTLVVRRVKRRKQWARCALSVASNGTLTIDRDPRCKAVSSIRAVNSHGKHTLQRLLGPCIACVHCMPKSSLKR